GAEVFIWAARWNGIRGARSRNNRVRPRHICGTLKLDVRIIPMENRLRAVHSDSNGRRLAQHELCIIYNHRVAWSVDKIGIKIISGEFELDAIDGGLVLFKRGLTRAAADIGGVEDVGK